MDNFDDLVGDLKERINLFIKSGVSEEKIIDFIRTTFCNSTKLDINILGFLLNFSLVTSNQSGCARNDCCPINQDSGPVNSDEDSSEFSSYDADDELGSEEVLMFPCHEIFDECHPEPLINYHPDHVRSSFTLVVAYPRLCEFILASIFKVLVAKINCDSTNSSLATSAQKSNDTEIISDSVLVSDQNDEVDHAEKSTLTECFNTLVTLIKKLSKVCSNEKRNCKILARTSIISLILKNIHYFILVAPEYQHIYLEPLFRLVLILADYKITGSHLRQIFNIIKDENSNLRVILENLEEFLDYQGRIMRNIQPMKSINFPTASMTAEEIEQDLYVSNSWHWKLRSRVIEHKRKRLRQKEDSELVNNSPTSNKKENLDTRSILHERAAPSWLECSLMTPLSNTSSLVQDGRLRLSCSLWLSVCGDLFVVDNGKGKKHESTSGFQKLNWFHSHKGHWTRLSSRKKLVEHRKGKFELSRRRSRRSSAHIRRRQANDKEDEEKEELEEKSRKNEMESNQVSIGSNRYKLFKSPKTFSSRETTFFLDNKQSEAIREKQSRMMSNSLVTYETIHLISFALESLTIELWLNVKSMLFHARVCQVARDGQTYLIDQRTFPSHLEARGSWSNVVICLTEDKYSTGISNKTITLKVIINAIHYEKVQLIYNMNSSDLSNFACLIGCERSAFGYVWKLSQFNIYKNIPDDNMLIYILGKGPDLWSFTNFQQQAMVKLPDLVTRSAKLLSDEKLLLRYGLIDDNLALDWLTQNIVMSYVAQQPDHFLDYTPRLTSASLMSSGLSDLSNSADRFIQAKALNFSRSIKLNTNEGFGTALVSAEGVETALICFADVVRRSHDSSDIQSMAFSVMLKLSQTNHYHLTKFLDELNGLRLAQFILEHPSCVISKSILDVYFNFCIIRHGQYKIIKSSRLVHQLLSSWRAWHKDLRVAKALYRKLLQLIKLPKHFRNMPNFQELIPYQIKYNLKMLDEAGGKDMLLGILKDCLVLANQGEHVINHDNIKLIIDLIRQLIKSPPGLDVLLDIMEFLIFLHYDVKSYVEVETVRLDFVRKLDKEYQRIMTSYKNQNRFGTPSSDTEQSSGELDDEVSENSYKMSENESSRNYLKVSDMSRYIIDYDSNSARFPMQTDVWLSRENSLSSKSNLHHFRRQGAFTISSESNDTCSNLDFTIASLTNILASIVQMASSSHPEIIRESLTKSIIDVRKLVILANNECLLVRENVLQVFLYSVQCSYYYDAESVVSRHEREGQYFNIHLPTTLMGFQLTKYPATMKMINMCYQTIISNNIQHTGDLDIAKFDTIDFDSESKNINLMLNTLILTSQLMTQLQSPKEIIDTLRFVCSFISRLGRSELYKAQLTFVIKEHLLDCVLRMYFSYAEVHINKSNRETATECISQDNLSGDNLMDLERELDRVLLFIIRTIIQDTNTPEAMRSLEDVMICFELMSGYLPYEFQHILRDRQVVVLSAALRYCKHYERCAKQHSYGGKLDYYFRSFFTSNESNTFNNNLPDSSLELVTLMQDLTSDDKLNSDASYTNGGSELTGLAESLEDQITNGFHEDESSSHKYTDDNALSNGSLVVTAEFSEANVIQRFLGTVRLILQFVLTRDEKIIPSPLERSFIIKYMQTLSSYINEHLSIRLRRRTRNGLVPANSQWSLMLPKLERKLHSTFARLIVYLLAPNSDLTNLDERKYYLSKVLDMFSVEHLIDMMNNDESKLDKRLARLLACVRDLKESTGSAINLESSADEQEAELFADETETKLRSLVEKLESRLGYQSKSGQKKFVNLTLLKLYDGDTDKLERRHLVTWLAKLAQLREIKRDKMNSVLSKDKTSFSTNGDSFCEDLRDEAAEITKEVVKDKNEQRKIDLEELKQTNVYNYQIRQQWLSLIYGHAHDRAIWFTEHYYPRSWELNPVEGPSRCRRRLRPCRLTLDQRFLRKKEAPTVRQPMLNFNSKSRFKMWQVPAEFNSNEWNNQWSNPHPLCSMIINNGQSLEPNELRTRMYTTDRIVFYCDCTIIRPNVVCKGEISVANWCVHFIEKRDSSESVQLCRSSIERAARGVFGGTPDEELAEDQAYSSAASQKTLSQLNDASLTRASSIASGVVEDLWYDEIVEIWDRRYELRDIGLEIFLTNNMNYLISFESTRDREDFKQNLMKEQHKMINLQRFSSTTSFLRLTQLWRDGRLTNFDYLTCLNKFAGRSFNDLMQYPIFPFVLSNYTSKTLDLNAESNFRKLDRAMAIQNEERKAIFIRNYELSQNSNLTAGTCGLTKPYHYSNHYSNSATVLHFLVRLPPFTQMLIQYQDNNFDQPDRTFHSMANTWQLITSDSNTDFKELIPEFFFLPEMFLNLTNLDLGIKQNNEPVDDVQLPDWCPNSDARLFTLIHRQALESAYVSENLHHWIDLIFGYKQTGRAAIDAINVFHPATYYGEYQLEKRGPHSVEDAATIKTAIANIYAKSQSQGSSSASTILAGQLRGQRSDDGSSSSSGKLEHSLIEQAALETMIKTYGQMPRQLFNQPVKQRSANTFVPQVNEVRLEQRLETQGIRRAIKREPLAQVKGLRWGSFVGSPEEDDILALKQKSLVSDENRKTKSKRKGLSVTNETMNASHKFQLCLLANGDVVIHRSNTSLMLDYRSDRKSPGMLQLSMVHPLRYSRRASLSNVARMNLFSNMIISRQQFSFLDPVHSPSSQLNSLHGSVGLAPKSGQRAKLVPDSLSLISWFYLDGTIRVRNPATSEHKPSVPLVQANTIVDSMSTCASVPQLNLLLVGYDSGSICAHIVTTSFETCPVLVEPSHVGAPLRSATTAAMSSSSAAPGAVHFLHHVDALNSADYGTVGRFVNPTVPAQSTVSLAGKTMQSVRTMHKTSRWLYCHRKRVNAIKINVSFGILVTASDDGTSVIWDLNSLTYVRTIDYKLSSSSRKFDFELESMAAHSGSHLRASSPQSSQRSMDFLCNCDNRTSPTHDSTPEHMRSEAQCCICASGVSLIAVSDTLGDIATVKHIGNRLASATDFDESEDLDATRSDTSSVASADSSESNECLSSVLYVHSINGTLIGFVCCHTKITAVCYSNAPEGISVNVIVVGLADGLVRMYSSWDLSRVKEFRVSGFGSPINSLMYTRDNQLLYVTYEDGQLLVLRSKKRGSIVVPKEWYL